MTQRIHILQGHTESTLTRIAFKRMIYVNVISTSKNVCIVIKSFEKILIRLRLQENSLSYTVLIYLNTLVSNMGSHITRTLRVTVF